MFQIKNPKSKEKRIRIESGRKANIPLFPFACAPLLFQKIQKKKQTKKPTPSEYNSQTFPFSFRLRSLLCCLLPPLNDALGPDAAKYEADAEPLHAAQPVAEPDDAEDHRQHFPRDGDGDEEQAGKMAERVVDEDLADGAAGGEAEDGVADRWVAADEGEGGGELVGGGGGQADSGCEWGGDEVGREGEI